MILVFVSFQLYLVAVFRIIELIQINLLEVSKMEKRKFKWRYLLISIPIAFFFSFADQGGNFYAGQIHAAGIFLIGLLIGLKKKNDTFILGNVISTMLFVSGVINLYSMPGTITTNILASSPLTLLPSFSAVLLAYAIFSVIREIYKLKKEDALIADKEKEHKLNLMIIPVSYLANIGLYILISKIIRSMYSFNYSSALDESYIWGNWHYQNDILTFEGLVFIALALISIPIYRGIIGNKKSKPKAINHKI